MNKFNIPFSFFLLYFISFPNSLFGQNKLGVEICKKGALVNSGIEVQAYPAGIIPGVFADIFVKRNLAINTRIAVNFANRHDWGVNDKEYGFGYGGTVGLRYFQKPSCKGFYGGIRCDVWREKIYWKNISFAPDKGFSKVLVVQPTIEFGYLWQNIKKSGIGIGINTAMGYEINTITIGKPVGQGLINLVGLLFTYNAALKTYPNRTIGTPSF